MKPKKEDKLPASVISLNDVAESARYVIQRLGLQEPPKPSAAHKEVLFPHDLSETPSGELGNQLGVWTAMKSFASFQRSLVEVNVEDLEDQIKRRVEDRMEVNKMSTATITEKKMSAMRQSDVRSARDKLKEAKAVHKLLDTLCLDFEYRYNAISREIARRQGGSLE
jgi:hypothetical protein